MKSAAEAAALEEIWWVIIGTTRFHLVARHPGESG